MKAIGLIPTRLNSTRLPQKALLEINNIPLVIHPPTLTKKLFTKKRESQNDQNHKNISSIASKAKGNSRNLKKR